MHLRRRAFVFFFNDTATTEIYTLSLHDALPISSWRSRPSTGCRNGRTCRSSAWSPGWSNRRETMPKSGTSRSEEHTSELQSHLNLVCRLLLEKKKKEYRLIQIHSVNHHRHEQCY